MVALGAVAFGLPPQRVVGPATIASMVPALQIRSVHQNAGLSCAALAQRVGVRHDDIGAYENGSTTRG